MKKGEWATLFFFCIRAGARSYLFPQLLGHLLVDGQVAWRDDDPIILPRSFNGHITIEHVAEHRRRIAFQRVAVATAGVQVDLHDIAGLERCGEIAVIYRVSGCPEQVSN